MITQQILERLVMDPTNDDVVQAIIKLQETIDKQEQLIAMRDGVINSMETKELVMVALVKRMLDGVDASNPAYHALTAVLTKFDILSDSLVRKFNKDGLDSFQEILFQHVNNTYARMMTK